MMWWGRNRRIAAKKRELEQALKAAGFSRRHAMTAAAIAARVWL